MEFILKKYTILNTKLRFYQKFNCVFKNSDFFLKKNTKLQT